jgi:gluconokinase
MPAIPLNQAEAPLVLSLDIGTSSVRALPFDAHAHQIQDCEVQKPYTLRTGADGMAEYDAEPLFDLLMQVIDGALRRCGKRAGEIKAVASSCFWHSLLGLDENWNPVTPVYYWGDTRSTRQVDELRASLAGSDGNVRTGCPIHSSYWPAKLHWLAEEEPERFLGVRHWCSFAEYVDRRLFGERAAGVSIAMASGTGLLGVRTLDWDPEFLTITGLSPGQLSSLVDFDQPSSGLNAPYRSQWPGLADLPWFPALGDGACANVGGGAVSEARIALTLGTSGAMRTVTTDAGTTIPPGLWMYRLDRRHCVLGGSLSNGGNLLTWLRRLLGNDPNYAAWTRAGALEPDAHGLTLLPFVAGERAPSWNDHASGVIAGLTLATTGTELLRAAMESVAYRLGRIYGGLASALGDNHAIVAGGGAILNSPAWLQIVADVLGHEIHAPSSEEEVSARGAAIMALVAIGALPGIGAAPDPAEGSTVYRPDPARQAIYRAAMTRQTRLEHLLFRDGGSWDAP